LPPCPNCKAPVESADRVYKVTVEPEQGERGITKRDVGMFRCQRCDTTFPRILGRVHYLLVPETELNRLKKEDEDFKQKAKGLEISIQRIQKEQDQREELLRNEVREGKIAGMESEVEQIEKHVRYLQAERDRLRAEIAEN
jgi:septal ring factor EnvC (AmiA/AmiB activator)